MSDAVAVPRISLSRLEDDGAALDAALQRHSFVILQDLPQMHIDTVSGADIRPTVCGPR